MGYEIQFSYRDLVVNEEGVTERGVYGDVVLTKKMKIGTSEDNLGLEHAAARIFSQFARRNILVTGVEIWEYSKKKLLFKETEDGFAIRGRKFRFDDGPALPPTEDVVDEQQIIDAVRANPSLLAQLTGKRVQQMAPLAPMVSLTVPGSSPIMVEQTSQALPFADPNMSPQQRMKQLEQAATLRQGQNVSLMPTASQPHQTARVLRWEVYDPDPVLIPLAKQHGLVFTPKKRYPIYGEKTGKNATDGMIYITIDDSGQQRNISDRYFVGPQATLLGEGEFIEDASNVVGGGGPEPQLSFSGHTDESMPSLRR